MVKVKGSAKLFPPDEDIEIPILAQFADYLSPEVRTVTVDDDGLLAGVSTDPEEDDTPFVAYLPLSVAGSLADCPKIQYSDLQELDRLGPGVNLSSYEDESGIPHKVAFKFNPLDKPQRLQMAWDELNLLKSLPPHPNIVPFDRIVLEEVESRVIGFTTKYIPGGTLDNTNVPFRFEWLQQLTQLVDFLNLELEWSFNRMLDSDVSKFRKFLNDWVASRKLDGGLERYLNAPNQLTWPDLPTAPDYQVPFELDRNADGEPIWATGPRFRRTAMEKGQYCFFWERQPQNKSLNQAKSGMD
ncbi:hypothetical protein APSETT445_003722 [Aspergillus pseudonomiae]